MRKVFTFIAIMAILLSANVWAAGVTASNLVCDNPAGCVDNTEIFGKISGSKIQRPENVKIVDQSGKWRLYNNNCRSCIFA